MGEVKPGLGLRQALGQKGRRDGGQQKHRKMNVRECFHEGGESTAPVESGGGACRHMRTRQDRNL